MLSDATEIPIQSVKGIGAHFSALLQKRGLFTLRDLLYFFPRSYEDRSRFLKISELMEPDLNQVPVMLSLKVLSKKKIPIALKKSRSILEILCADDSGTITLKWFHCPFWLEERFLIGANVSVVGKVKIFRNQLQMHHPELIEPTNSQIHSGRVVPIYSEIEGISSKKLRQILWQAIQQIDGLKTEIIPDFFLEKRKLIKWSEAIKSIHFPPLGAEGGVDRWINKSTIAHQRIFYEELFKLQYLILRKKKRLQQQLSYSIDLERGRILFEKIIKNLDFCLTPSQQQAIKDILSDFSNTYPMYRMIQGDVGSGKTIVALLSSLFILEMGYSVVFMAPTEILAQQHFKNTLKLLKNDYPVFLLTSKTPYSERQKIQSCLLDQMPLFLIGTHALLEETIQFDNVGYWIIDEQHRFGVAQRSVLKQKTISFNPQIDEKRMAHGLILTATPIPRTLALSFFGDLQVTLIRENPLGRKPVKTYLLQKKSNQDELVQRVRKELEKGRQAYFIYPLIQESEAEGFSDLKSVLDQANFLTKQFSPDYSVSVLHGKMTSEAKNEVMALFKNKSINILVSTTVVEVGIDVPNATVIVIENAERFGLSQLHQLRGRVGRGAEQSYCFLLTNSSENISERLKILEKTNDGFEIAEFDLMFRGPGEFLGVKQSGDVPFFLEYGLKNASLLEAAHEDVKIMFEDEDKLNKFNFKSLEYSFYKELQKDIDSLTFYK